MNLSLIRRAIARHFKMQSLNSYERVLRDVKARGDVWMTSQGEYIRWWQRRNQAWLVVRVSNGECTVSSDLDGAVFQRFPDRFLETDRTACENATFSGEVRLVVDSTLKRKHLLVDALKREGIMNVIIGEEGQFFLSHELDAILQKMEGHLQKGEWRAYDRTICEVRDVAVARLAACGLPTIRIWYHPRIKGRIMNAVFSPRYDVDRAITNMPKIFRLERRYDVSSTAYLRVFHPFYTDAEIRRLAALPYVGELALHAEFTQHAQEFGSERAAAEVEKAHLESLIGQPVEGISIHGGEVFSNTNRDSWRVIEDCGFVYDTAHGPLPYYFPYRLLNGDGQLDKTFRLRYHFRDIGVPFEDFNNAFYAVAMQKLEETLAHHGVLVLLLHPEYFGFFSYLFNPKNFVRFMRFLPTYLTRTLRSGTQRAVTG